MFTLEGPHIVMSRTDAQNGLDFHFNIVIYIKSTEATCHWKAPTGIALCTHFSMNEGPHSSTSYVFSIYSFERRVAL
jgi:hypothetical protein